MIKCISYWSIEGGLANTRPVDEAFDEARAAGFAGIELAVGETGVITPSTDEATCVKYRASADLEHGERGGTVKRYLEHPRGLRTLAALDAIAARHDATPAAVALAWVMTRAGVTAPIASATSIAQVDALTRATQLALTADDLAELD